MLTCRTSGLSASCGGHEFSFGVAFAFPGSHEQHFASERITEYVVDIGRAIDFKETRTADVCTIQPGVEQNTQLGKLFRLVLPELFNHLRSVYLFIFLG